MEKKGQYWAKSDYAQLMQAIVEFGVDMKRIQQKYYKETVRGLLQGRCTVARNGPRVQDAVPSPVQRPHSVQGLELSRRAAYLGHLEAKPQTAKAPGISVRALAHAHESEY